MTAYYELSSSLDRLASLAMDRLLRQHGFRKGEGSRYYQSVTEEEVYDHGHRWTHHVGPAGSAVFAKSSPQEFHDHYRERLHRAFSPWDRSKLPSAPELRAYGRIMYDASNQGYPNVDRSRDVSNGNPQLATALRRIDQNIGRIQGNTVITFSSQYLAPMGGVLSRQACVATLLGVTLMWEADVWHHVDIDLKDLVDDALHKMDFDSDAGGLKELLTVASAASNIGALLTGSPFVAGASVAFGILKDLVPDGHPDTRISLSGDDPDEIINSIEKKLAGINRWVRAHESGIRRALLNGSAKADEERDDFDLRKPRALLREDDRDELVLTSDQLPLDDDQKDLLRLERHAVRVVAHEGLGGVADELDRSRHTSDRASSSSVWLRSDDRVGIGDKGPWSAWDDLFDRHRHMLTETARELREAGQHLLVATHHLFDTDEQVDQELRAHTRRIHA
jgi:hypothetical protein